MMKAIWVILLLFIMAACFSFTTAEEPPQYEAEVTSLHEAFVYGTSELGLELICHRIGSLDATQSLLIVFGVHGFEDDFNHDGEVLRLIAEKVIEHYANQPELLGDFCLYIVPSANPDGLIDGKTKDGFGRCNALGLDINRDFPVKWKKSNNVRTKTGEAPFSSSEARAIRDLVEDVKPAYGIDVHGWIRAAYGDGVMAEVFAKPFKFSVRAAVSGGMLFQWLDEVTEEAIMIELPFSPNKKKYVNDNSERLIQGIDAWIRYCSTAQAQ